MHFDKVFNTIEISIHDLVTEKEGGVLSPELALVKIDRDAQGPFPKLTSYDALNEDTPLAVLERKRTELNVPVAVLHKISARELQSAKPLKDFATLSTPSY